MNIKTWTAAIAIVTALSISLNADAQRGGGRNHGGGGGFRGGGSFHSNGGGNRGGGFSRGNFGGRPSARPLMPSNRGYARPSAPSSRGYARPSTPSNNFRPGEGTRGNVRGFAPRPNYNPGRNSMPARRYVPIARNGRPLYGYRGGYSYGYHYGRPYYGYPSYYRHYTTISFGGIGYRYYNGFFYRPWSLGLRLIFPPLGIHIGYLPYGYYPFYLGADPYYYYGGIFYEPYYGGGYQVVAPPLNALVPELPAGAQAREIDGAEYYEYNGTFYKEEDNGNGETWYRVVGVNGRLETGIDQGSQQYQDNQPYDGDDDYEYQPTPQNEQQEQALPQSQGTPHTGDMVYQLPDNCKQLTINNEQYFLSPDGIYYQEVIGDDNHVMYQIVDKPGQANEIPGNNQ